jgi:hypothetical protein
MHTDFILFTLFSSAFAKSQKISTTKARKYFHQTHLVAPRVAWLYAAASRNDTPETTPNAAALVAAWWGAYKLRRI